MSKKFVDVDGYDTYDLWAHTESHLERPRMKYPYKGSFRPSEASVVYFDEDGDKVTEGGCLRAAFYRLKGFEAAPDDARAQMIFAMGNAVESFLVEQWKQMGIWVDNDVRFFNADYGFPLKGALDTILVEPPDAKLYGVEVKSFYGYYATREIMGNSKVKGKPKMGYLMQALIYSQIFRKELYCFRLVFMARDDPSQHRTFKIELHEEDGLTYPKVDGEVWRQFTVEDILDRYRKLQEYLDKDELPPRDYEDAYSDEKIEDLFSRGKLSKAKYTAHTKGKKVGDWNCAYCRYRDQCYKKANL